MTDELKRLRAQEARWHTCVVCSALLQLPESPPHCHDCTPTEDDVDAWKDFIHAVDVAADAPIRMWLVHDLDRWGYSLNVVRAFSKEEAFKLVCPNGARNPALIQITPLPMEGAPALLWAHEESPDTPR